MKDEFERQKEIEDFEIEFGLDDVQHETLNYNFDKYKTRRFAND